MSRCAFRFSPPARNLGDVVTTNPTVGSNVEEVSHRGVRFQVWDLGGQDKLRKVWSTYYVGAHAVVLVIDSMDRERLPLVRAELEALTANDELRRAVLLVLANKQDMQGAMSPMEITQQVCLQLELRPALPPRRLRHAVCLGHDHIMTQKSSVVSNVCTCVHSSSST